MPPFRGVPRKIQPALRTAIIENVNPDGKPIRPWRRIAAELNLDPATVSRGVSRLRIEMVIPAEQDKKHRYGDSGPLRALVETAETPHGQLPDPIRATPEDVEAAAGALEVSPEELRLFYSQIIRRGESEAAGIAAGRALSEAQKNAAAMAGVPVPETEQEEIDRCALMLCSLSPENALVALETSRVLRLKLELKADAKAERTTTDMEQEEAGAGTLQDSQGDASS